VSGGGVPPALAELLEEMADLDRAERMEYLIEYADRFRNVPDRIATRPYAEERRVKRCESQAYVWAEDAGPDAQRYHFAVENPQGVSAKSFCAILDETVSGAPLAQVTAIPGDAVFAIYGREISMGKGEGLLGILDAVRGFAREAAVRAR